MRYADECEWIQELKEGRGERFFEDVRCFFLGGVVGPDVCMFVANVDSGNYMCGWMLFQCVRKASDTTLVQSLACFFLIFSLVLFPSRGD